MSYLNSLLTLVLTDINYSLKTTGFVLQKVRCLDTDAAFDIDCCCGLWLADLRPEIKVVGRSFRSGKFIFGKEISPLWSFLLSLVLLVALDSIFLLNLAGHSFTFLRILWFVKGYLRFILHMRVRRLPERRKR